MIVLVGTKKGITIRKPVDCIIASVAIENKIPLLHNDRDFNEIYRYSKLSRRLNEKNSFNIGRRSDQGS